MLPDCQERRGVFTQSCEFHQFPTRPPSASLWMRYVRKPEGGANEMRLRHRRLTLRLLEEQRRRKVRLAKWEVRGTWVKARGGTDERSAAGWGERRRAAGRVRRGVHGQIAAKWEIAMHALSCSRTDCWSFKWRVAERSASQLSQEVKVRLLWTKEPEVRKCLVVITITSPPQLKSQCYNKTTVKSLHDITLYSCLQLNKAYLLPQQSFREAKASNHGILSGTWVAASYSNLSLLRHLLVAISPAKRRPALRRQTWNPPGAEEAEMQECREKVFPIKWTSHQHSSRIRQRHGWMNSVLPHTVPIWWGWWGQHGFSSHGGLLCLC